MKDRFRNALGVVVPVVVVVAVVTFTASAQAAPSAAARLTVRSTEYGKALFGPSGKAKPGAGSAKKSKNAVSWRPRSVFAMRAQLSPQAARLVRKASATSVRDPFSASQAT